MKEKLLVTALVLPTLFWIKTAWLPGTHGLPIAHAPQATQATTIELANHLEQVANGIFVQGSYVYVGEGVRLSILDISDPVSPTLVGQTPPLTSTVGFGSVEDIYVSGGRAYVATGYGGLRIVDTSVPTFPVEIGFYAATVHHVIVRDNPIEIGAYIRGWPAYNLQAADGYVYLIGEYGLRLLDISDPANPVVVSFYNREWSPRWDNEYDLAVAGEYIYVAAEDEGLFILRRSDAAPLVSVSIDGPTTGLYDAAYRFTATISPSTPLVPVTYTWAPVPDSGQGTDAATYTWPRWSIWYPTGDKTVSVMAVNAEGTAIDTHAITIYPAGTYLPIVAKIHE
jgi:hypothetical protein